MTQQHVGVEAAAFAHRRPNECRQVVSPEKYKSASGPLAMTTPVSWLHYDPENYDELLADKVKATKEQFAPWLQRDEPEFIVYPTSPSNFRERTRFAIARLPTPDSDLCYALFDGGAPSVAVESFPIASKRINELMPALLRILNASPVLGSSLAAAHFLGTQSGDMLVSLIYGAAMAEGWAEAAEACRTALGVPSLMGRSKGECIVLGKGNWVEETLRLDDGRALTYRQAEGSFSNPSAAMAERTLSFLCGCAEQAAAACGEAAAGRPLNLLELYCGNGNHTAALARHFHKVLCVEIDRKLCDAADLNLARNGVSNAHVLCVSSGTFCKRLLRRLKAQRRDRLAGRPWDETQQRQQQQQQQQQEARPARIRLRPVSATALSVSVTIPSRASTGSGATRGVASSSSDRSSEAAWLREVERAQDVILVDPPRSGLDEDTRALVAMYEHILYVSCNPAKLREDMETLGDEYEVRRFAIFDHFAYSGHLECGAYLRRRKRPEHAGGEGGHIDGEELSPAQVAVELARKAEAAGGGRHDGSDEVDELVGRGGELEGTKAATRSEKRARCVLL